MANSVWKSAVNAMRVAERASSTPKLELAGHRLTQEAVVGARVYTTLEHLERDLKLIATEFKPRVAGEVRDTARDGNRAAQRLAKVSAGRHGKHYHKAFSVERRTPLQWEWGPDADKPQGGMSFERGSRNSPGHHDIAKGADLHGAADLSRRTNHVLDELFWP